jgi:predicted nucleotidyltransferase
MKETIIDNIFYMKKLRQRIDGKEDFEDFYEVVNDFYMRNMLLAQKINTPFIAEESIYLIGLCALIKKYFIKHEQELKELWNKQIIVNVGAMCLN